jgi:hypothetical protein
MQIAEGDDVISPADGNENWRCIGAKWQAHAFYAAATGVDPEESGGIDRQIREAMKRLPIERQRAQRKSVEKPRVSS